MRSHWLICCESSHGLTYIALNGNFRICLTFFALPGRLWVPMEHTRCPAKPKNRLIAKTVFSQAYFRCHPTWSAHKGLPLLVIPGDGLARRPGSGASRWLVTVDGWNPARKPVEVGSFSHYLRGFSTISGGAGFLPSTAMFSLFMRFGKGCSLSSMKMFGNLGGTHSKVDVPLQSQSSILNCIDGFIWMFSTKNLVTNGVHCTSWEVYLIPLCGPAAFGWYHIT